MQRAGHPSNVLANIMAKLYPPGMGEPRRDRELAASLAENLHSIRRQRGLTQARLARLCAIPRSTVAQLESGSGNPTLHVISRLSAALRISIEEILATPHPRCQLFRKGTLPSSLRGRGGSAVVRKLLPDPIPGMEIDRLELRPGARITGIPHRPGTREYLTCERGRLTLRASGESYVLEPGDVLAFQGDQAHSYGNEGKVVAVGFSVVTLSPAPWAPNSNGGG